MEIVTAAAAAGTGAVAAVVGIQAAAGALVPVAMAALGKVVAGVGTFTVARGIVAWLQSISMVATPIGPAFVTGATLVVGAKLLIPVLL